MPPTLVGMNLVVHTGCGLRKAWNLFPLESLLGNDMGREGPVLLPSSVSEELRGEGRGGKGLPNNVFGVWSHSDPPVIGFDDGGH